MSEIEWTDETWNPIVGCKKVSPGCAHCYAETMSRRLAAMAQAAIDADKDPGRKGAYMDVVDSRGRFNGNVVIQSEALGDPLRWKNPRTVFVNSMSDLFHEDVPRGFLSAVWKTMESTPRHTYQILTKRPERMMEWALSFSTTAGHTPCRSLPNVWLGTSVEDRKRLGRVDTLRHLPAALRFLSIEPLLEDLGEIDLTGIGWVIVGGESGSGARPMHPDWVRSIRDECQRQLLPFFFKQWGGVSKKAAGRELDGRTWDEMPTRYDPRAELPF